MEIDNITTNDKYNQINEFKSFNPIESINKNVYNLNNLNGLNDLNGLEDLEDLNNLNVLEDSMDSISSNENTNKKCIINSKSKNKIIKPINIKLNDYFNITKIIDISNQNLEGTLDFSAISNLNVLSCKNNKITKIVGNYLNLNTLECSKNKLTKIDLLNLPIITSLYCSDNLIE